MCVCVCAGGGEGGVTCARSWTGILATASSACQTERDGKTAKPGWRGRRPNFGVVEARGKKTAAMGASGAHQKAARRVGAGRQPRGAGWECSGGRGVCARSNVLTETCSPPRVAAFGTAACWTVAWQRSCLDGPFWCTRGRLLGLPCDHYAKTVRACITAWSCVAVRLV